MIKSVCEYFYHLAKEKLHSFVPCSQDNSSLNIFKFHNFLFFFLLFFILLSFVQFWSKVPNITFHLYLHTISMSPCTHFPMRGGSRLLDNTVSKKGNNTTSSIPHPAALTHTLSRHCRSWLLTATSRATLRTAELLGRGWSTDWWKPSATASRDHKPMRESSYRSSRYTQCFTSHLAAFRSSSCCCCLLTCQSPDRQAQRLLSLCCVSNVS